MAYVKLAKIGELAEGEYPFNVISIDDADLVTYIGDGTEENIGAGYVLATEEEFQAHGVSPVEETEEVAEEVEEPTEGVELSAEGEAQAE